MSSHHVSDRSPEVRRTATLLFGPAVLVLMVATFWWTARWMVIRWEQPNSYYSHGWLIPPISAVLLYLRRKRISACPVRPCRWGLLLLVPSILLHLLATAWQVGFLSGFALLGFVAGLVLTLFGTQMLGITLFPLAFLAFMIPVPEVLIETVSFRLKLAAARVAAGVVGLLGLVAIREGSYIRTPTGTVVVDDVCSGLKYLISLTAFGALYACISSLKGWWKGLLFLLSVPISFVANVTRVTLMVLVAYRWGSEATQEWYVHDLFGFALFVTAFAMLFAAESVLLSALSWGRKGREGLTDEPPDPADGTREGTPARAARPAKVLSGAVLSVLLVTAAASSYLAWPRGTAAASDTLASVPQAIGGWYGFDTALSERVYEILGTRDVLSRIYTNESGERTELLIVLAHQTRRRTHPPEQCLSGEGYSMVGASDQPVGLVIGGQARAAHVRELVLERNDRRRIVWYFYKSGSHLNTSYWRHQAGVALRKLANPDAADVLIRVDTDAPDRDDERGRRILRDFLARAMPAILAHLP